MRETRITAELRNKARTSRFNDNTEWNFYGGKIEMVRKIESGFYKKFI